MLTDSLYSNSFNLIFGHNVDYSTFKRANLPELDWQSLLPKLQKHEKAHTCVSYAIHD